MTFPEPPRAEFSGITRRQLRDRENQQKRSQGLKLTRPTPNLAPPARPARRSRRSLRARAKSVGGVMAVASLLATTVLPGYAIAQSSAFGAQAPVAAAAVMNQSLTVPLGAASVETPLARDTFNVTKTVPGAAPYSRVADTFVNNPNSPIQWPLLVGAPISSGFGWRSCAGCPAYHKGIDITPGMGTPIQAIADGVVLEVRDNDPEYGSYVLIQHQIDGQTISSRYAHMIEGSSPLAVGDVVSVGALVGQVGNTGLSTGAHVHFEILLDGVTPTDPYAWLKAKVGS